MGTRVLIVDDDSDLAESLAEVLSGHGFDVSIAEHGREAVACVCAAEFDIIFMDVRMPIMNGVDCFFAIKSVKPDARVVMMTGFKETFVERAIQAGAEGPLHKPFAIEDMLALVASCGRTAATQRPAPTIFVTRSPSSTIH